MPFRPFVGTKPIAALEFVPLKGMLEWKKIREAKIGVCEILTAYLPYKPPGLA